MLLHEWQAVTEVLAVTNVMLASKDALGANLQDSNRQGVGRRERQQMDKMFDVAWFDDPTVGVSGKLSAAGNMLDLETAT